MLFSVHTDGQLQLASTQAGYGLETGTASCILAIGKVLFYVKIHVKLPQVFIILREYSHNVRSAKFHIWRENSR